MLILNKSLCRALLLTLLASTFAFSQSVEDSLTSLRQHFEWGEYKQLYEGVIPFVNIADSLQNPALCALMHSYLGVSNYALKKMIEAAHEFETAYQCDSLFRLDSEYISSEMYNFITAAQLDVIGKRREGALKDSLSALHERELESNHKLLASIELQNKRQGVGINLASTIVSFGVSAGACAFLIEGATASKKYYQDFLTAAEVGDRAQYDALKIKVRKSDLITMVATGVGLVSLGCGTVFSFLTVKNIHGMQVKMISSAHLKIDATGVSFVWFL